VPATVLIVDDHPGFRTGLRRLLDAEGFTVVGEAARADEALAAVARLAPDIVLLDVHLPDGTGFEVADRLAAMNGASPVVILMSTRAAEDLATLLEATSARAFISKSALSGEAIRAALTD
jgi:DNA-binding NarL/FixJ family response regulator